MKGPIALLAAALLLLPAVMTAGTAIAAPAVQTTLARGAVVRLTGTPHLWIGGDDGALHWAGDTRALAGRFVDWGNAASFSVDQIRAFRRGDPWLSAGLLKMGDPIYFVKWESDAPAPTLLHIQSIADVELFGINASNYGAMVLDQAPWEARFGVAAGVLPRGELQAAVALAVGSTRQSAVPLGTGAETSNGWRITVLSVKPNANSIIAATNRFNEPPKLGSQLFMARVAVTRTGATSASFVRSNLRAVGDAGVGYTTFNNSCGVIPDPLPSNELFSGGSVIGNVCWQVLSSDVGSLAMYFDPSYDATGRVYLALR